VVAGLLDHVLHADEGCLIVSKRLLQRLDGFADLLAVLSRWPIALLWTNEAIRENGLDERKRLFAARLST